MDYITIASAGNAADFGNYGRPTSAVGGCSDGTRGVIAGGGMTGDSTLDIIEYLNDNINDLVEKTYKVEMNVPLLLEAKIGSNWLDTVDV